MFSFSVVLATNWLVPGGLLGAWEGCWLCPKAHLPRRVSAALRALPGGAPARGRLGPMADPPSHRDSLHCSPGHQERPPPSPPTPTPVAHPTLHTWMTHRLTLPFFLECLTRRFRHIAKKWEELSCAEESEELLGVANRV